jgi:pimeloyl-ACP methyl ester carboxylesterase
VSSAVAQSSRRTITAPDGTRLAFDSYGSTGPGLLVLSGSVVHPDRCGALAGALSPGFTVHVLHRRGRGASGPQGPQCSVDLEAADTLTVMAETGSRILFGHSYGGLLAVRVGLTPDAPSLVQTVIAYEPPLPVNGSLPVAFVPSFEQAVAARKFARAQTILTRGLSVGGVLDRLPIALETAVYWLMQHTIARELRHTLGTFPAEVSAARTIDGPADLYQSVQVRPSC